MEDTKETELLDTTGLMHLGTHGECNSLQRSKIGRVPALGEEVDISSIPNQELSLIDNYLQRKISFL